mmetsp:Transcript_78501/g.138249  ORF Transcript_78501/g.138249 Transcript_78501/m.138249 type:complete len:631 (-) Transcript_78501:112-2004(-)
MSGAGHQDGTPMTSESASSTSRNFAEVGVEVLEQKFESDFGEYIKERTRKQNLKLGAVGAGIGGAVGWMAAPILLPGLTVAALVGAASGYSLSKHWGKQELQREVGDPDAEGAEPAGDASQGLPTMRRLKFMVRWCLWQLRDYEQAPAEARHAVLDEVTRVFSPWVQQLYLLRTKSAFDDAAETAEVQDHLAPFFFLLHRKSVVETIESAAVTLGRAFDKGTVDSVGAERARVIFPIILETISSLDRVSPATMEQLLKIAAASAKLQSSFSDQRSHLRRRLQLIVSSIRAVVERDDVQKSLADPKFCIHKGPRPTIRIPLPSEGEHDCGVSNAPSSPAESVASIRPGIEPLQLPPIGAEQDDDEEVFLSMSDGSDNESAKPSRTASAKIKTSGIKARCQAYARGHKKHSWNVGDVANWPIRSETYFKDRRKLPCCSPMLELLHCDWVALGETPIRKVSEHKDFFPALARKDGDERFFFVLNFVIGSFQAVITMALKPDAPWLANSDSPQARVWNAFLDGDDEKRAERLKLILSVDEGPWLVKRAFIKKPMLICKLLNASFHHKPNDYFEVDFEPTNGPTIGMVLNSMKRSVLSCALLIEAKELEELPENLLATAVSNYVEPGRICLPAHP